MSDKCRIKSKTSNNNSYYPLTSRRTNGGSTYLFTNQDNSYYISVNMADYIFYQIHQHCVPFFTTKLINIVDLFQQEIHEHCAAHLLIDIPRKDFQIA